MIDIPGALSPIKPDPVSAPDALASGPFVFLRTDVEGDRIIDIGFDLLQADAAEVTWWDPDRSHTVIPTDEPVVDGSAIRFTQAEDGSSYVIRPLTVADSYLVGEDPPPSDPLSGSDGQQALVALAELIWSLRFSDPIPVEMGEDNLYLSRDEAGEPLALIKMGSGFPTMVRQDSGWRPIGDDEDLLGVDDQPIREDAVTAWDSGNIQMLTALLVDDRFAPGSVLHIWAEVGDDESIKRLLIERTRGRFYERTADAKWEPAQPDPEATTIDLLWSAVGAWDSGDLRQLSQAQQFDVDGEAA